MRRPGKRPALLAVAGTAIAGVAAAVALAATGPGTPETREYGGGFDAVLVKASARNCEGTDGSYLELVGRYQAPTGSTESSDPRFAGLADFYLHQLLHFDDSGGVTGHVNGTVTYYASDTGPRTATAKVAAKVATNAAGDFFPYAAGFIGGAGGTDDGIALPYAGLPRAHISTPVTFSGLFEIFGVYGTLIADVEDTEGDLTTGGVLQSFNCTTPYRQLIEPAAASRLARQALGTAAVPARAQRVEPLGTRAQLSAALLDAVRRGGAGEQVADGVRRLAAARLP